MLRHEVTHLNEPLHVIKTEIYENAPEWMQPAIRRATVRVTATHHGHASLTRKTATIPLWAWNKGHDFTHYYLAHELAHLVTRSSGHGPEFQSALARLSPYAYFELGYRPKSARAAGIRIPEGAALVQMA
jgi:predicted metal-dependent hydrolase